jgi:hypothetical protein
MSTIPRRKVWLTGVGVFALAIGLYASLPSATLIAFTPNKEAPCVEQQGAPPNVDPDETYFRASTSLWPLGERCTYTTTDGGRVSVDPPWTWTLGAYGGGALAIAGVVILASGKRGRRVAPREVSRVG